MKPFHFFKTDILRIQVPEKFTFPFYYEPHTLAKIAMEEVQFYLENQTDFEHNFGLETTKKTSAIGKMFGVLVVENQQGKLGFLTAFSGKLADESCPDFFVPPVFNLRTENSLFKQGEAKINQINAQIDALQNDQNFVRLKKEVAKTTKKIEEDLKKQRKKLKLQQKDRKHRKKHGIEHLLHENNEKLLKKLQQESFNDQFFYKELVEYYQLKTSKNNQKLAAFKNEIKTLKNRRKEISAKLQTALFRKFEFLNYQKETKNLFEIFNNPAVKPPAGSGECAAPKLLQFAFKNNLRPVCLGEFWWGGSPSSEVRKHKNVYPACQSRCKPILNHMLNGIKMEEDLLIREISTEKSLEIIYEDNELVVVNKPAEFLSVPGKTIKDSVYSRIKKQFPNATGPLIVHRLDMSTSGILVLTKTKEANTILQRQFIERTVKKRYVALLDGILEAKKGEIKLPLRVDLDDRPKQLVCYEYGKNATTKWEVIVEKEGKTRVYFYPITGRTHQLRVHSAHKNGLNCPIFGDDLYGKKEDRLHLHANFIEFSHPKTSKKMSFCVEPEF